MSNLIVAAPEMFAALRANYAWTYAEHNLLGSFDLRCALCAHAESLTARALAKIEGRQADTYKGTKKLIVWPQVNLEESNEAEGDALVNAVFEHIAAHG